MNDEIKEILEFDFECQGERIEINEYERDILKNYITNLQQKVEQYENPEDLTLFYMWIDEKAKDKMKKLQQENERLKGELEWWKQQCDDLEMQIGDSNE